MLDSVIHILGLLHINLRVCNIPRSNFQRTIDIADCVIFRLICTVSAYFCIMWYIFCISCIRLRAGNLHLDDFVAGHQFACCVAIFHQRFAIVHFLCAFRRNYQRFRLNFCRKLLAFHGVLAVFRHKFEPIFVPDIRDGFTVYDLECAGKVCAVHRCAAAGNINHFIPGLAVCALSRRNPVYNRCFFFRTFFRD